MAQTLTTQLEAVNAMLRAIGEAPVNSITGSGIPSDVQIAINLLNETSRDVQTPGLPWNSERDFLLPLNVDGTITLGANVLSCKQTPGQNFVNTIEILQRGLNLYDKLNHTYVFTVAPYCDIILYLSWDELPEVMRTYIKLKAARKYQDGLVGSQELHGFTAADEMLAWVSLNEAVAEQEQATIFDNYDIGSIFQNRRRPIR